MQGFTEFPLRNAFVAAGVAADGYVAPFVDAHEFAKGKARKLKDLALENNASVSLVPQLLGSNPDELAALARWFKELGYSNISLNLGCPYPMVALKGAGSGLIAQPDIVDRILAKLFSSFPDISLSVKTRLGYSNSLELDGLVSVLNSYTLAEVVVHPRIGRQLYKGELDLDTFDKVVAKLNAPVCYSGDILTLADFRQRQQRYPSINRWMIGRGALQNPLIFSEIRTGLEMDDEARLKVIEAIHNELFQYYVGALSGDSHLLKKIGPFWDYFGAAFPERRKLVKKVKKATKAEHYRLAAIDFFKV
jgi:tRNA-dihydrouridine synthase